MRRGRRALEPLDLSERAPGQHQRDQQQGLELGLETIDPQRQPDVPPEKQTREPIVWEEFDAQPVTLRMSVLLEP